MATYTELLEAQTTAGKLLCVGIDPDPARFPPRLRAKKSEDALGEFVRCIIDATGPLVGAFKPNIAFFEQHGPPGLAILKKSIQYSRSRYPDIPIIVDAKRGDIAASNRAYAGLIFGYLEADATTLHAYLGEEALRPFLDLAGKGLYILCRTSNAGAGEVQDRETDGIPLYLYLADRVAHHWISDAQLGLVIGATYPFELERVRKIAPKTPFLIPGVGAQGGDVEAALIAGFDSDSGGLLINASSSVIHASRDDDFAERAHDAAAALDNEIRTVRSAVDPATTG